jgi:cytochrome c-type biogenesis protein CcmF
VFSVLMTPLLFLLGLAPLSRWKTTDISLFLQNTWIIFIVCIALSFAIPFIFSGNISFGLLLGLFLSFWIILVTLQDLAVKSKFFRRLDSLSLSYYGMVIAHIGMAVTALGIVVSSHYSVERDVRLLPGQTATLSHYTFEFLGTHAIVGSNYKGIAGDVAVFKNGSDTPFTSMDSEKRVYIVQNFESTKADINSNLVRDLYVSLGDQYDDNSWSLRLYVKPFIRWIWAGGFMMMLGGLLAMFDRRYKVKK